VRKTFYTCGLPVLLGLAAVLWLGRSACGYIEAAYSLGKAMTESTNIVHIVVESVDKQKNIIIYRKLKDLKGNHPGDTIKHNIGQAGFHPREWQNIMAWAEPGKTAVMFHNGGAAETCVDNYWYQTSLSGDWWNMTHAEPYWLRTFAGKPDKLVVAVTAMLAGKEAIVPCMVDGDKNALHLRTARLQRMKVSLALQEYNAQRDFVDFSAGGDELRAVAGMPGFTHELVLNRLGAGAVGVATADINGDGRPDVCVYGVNQLLLFQNSGNSFEDVRLPVTGGARAAAWGDYDGDGKPDLLLATPTGPRLLHNTGKQFDDVSAGLPRQGYYNLRAAAWIDYDGDGRPDILLADGFQGLRLYRNLGKQARAAAPGVGKWYYAGPFDNPNQQGFDNVYPPEQGVDLTKEYVGKSNQKVVWKEGNFVDGQPNSLMLFTPACNENAVAYVYREFNVPGAVEMPIGLGSDDTLTVWLNGQKILAQNVYRGCTPDEVQLKLSLRPGKNALLMKICQGSGEWSFWFSAKAALATVPALFEDVSDAVGLGANGVGGSMKGDHLAVADVNGDGRPDFLYSAGDGLLVLNTPQGFVEAKDSGLAYRTGGVTPCFGAFTGDGRPDLFIPQEGVCKLLRNDGAGHFSDVTSKAGDLARPVGDARCAAWVDVRKERPDLLIGCWKGPNRYFRNNGGGAFSDATEDLGLLGRIFNTSGLAAVDLNKDKAPDFVFANEGQDSLLLLSNPAWHAEKTAEESRRPAEAAMRARLATSASGGSIAACVLAVTAAVVIALFVARSRRRRGGDTVSLVVFAILLAFSGLPDRRTTACALEVAAADWPTARGNPQRTGTVDDLPGPKVPIVLWVYKSREHYVASPVPGGNAIYVAAVGALNTGMFRALALAHQAPDRVLWSKTAPYIVRPTVCAPVVSGGLVIFGDGMHQTDDAVLYCVQAGSGVPVWQYPLPGKLVHLEAAPTMDKGRVYICGGDAGVLCLDAKRLTLDGKDQDVGDVIPLQTKRWADLTARYEQDKKKDPVLAIPPSEDALPKPSPKLVWQQGKGAWHIDAPAVVAGDFVLAASAYLDDEKIGKRSLLCLKAADGALVWEAPLNLNPWAGPTVAGPLVLVGCSNIRFDRKLIGQARGEIVAVDLANGQVRWRQNVGGGVLSPVSVKGDVAVCTSTDGKVTAYNRASGQPVWTYQAKQPFFAGPAIAANTVYVADLKAGVHALNLADGKLQWTHDVAADPAVQAQSMVYGSPVLHGGELYLATCNVEGEANQPCYVVCLSDKGAVAAAAVPITINREKRFVSIPCRVAPRKLPTLTEVYPLEVIATYPSPRGEKAHETVVVFDCRPSDVHKALESLALKPGKPVRGDDMATGPEVKISLEVPGVTGTPRVIPMDKILVDTRTGKTMPPMTWHFTGSVRRQPDPQKEDTVYGADLTGTLISLLPVTDETVCQAHLTMTEGKVLRLDTNKNLLPEEGAPVKLIIEAK